MRCFCETRPGNTAPNIHVQGNSIGFTFGRHDKLVLIHPQRHQYILYPTPSPDSSQSHYVRAVQLENWRRQQILLALADRLVFTLSDVLVAKLGTATTARTVMISAERQRHILDRRTLVSEFDADLAAHRIHEALEDCRFLVLQRKPNIYELIGYAFSADRFILVALKLVPSSQAKTSQDEWWVQTAHPLGKKKLRRHIAKGQVTSL